MPVTNSANLNQQSLIYKDFQYVALPNGRMVRVLRSLGRGEYGHVYLGELGHRYVVIKILRSKIGRSADENAFYAEASLMSTLKHPHLVNLVAHGRRPSLGGFEGNEPYMVMEFAGDRTLRETFVQQGASLLPFHDTLCILRSVAEAIAYLHEQQIGHFDVKPDNIMLDAMGRPMLGDFGLARHQTSVDFSVGRGTPAYTAPEAMQGQQSLKSDTWSFGVTLYETFTGGMLPFVAAGNTTIKDVVIKSTPTTIPVRLKIPPVIQQLISDMLTKDPESRLSMAAVVSRMSEIIATLDPHSPLSGPPSATDAPLVVPPKAASPPLPTATPPTITRSPPPVSSPTATTTTSPPIGFQKPPLPGPGGALMNRSSTSRSILITAAASQNKPVAPPKPAGPNPNDLLQGLYRISASSNQQRLSSPPVARIAGGAEDSPGASPVAASKAPPSPSSVSSPTTMGMPARAGSLPVMSPNSKGHNVVILDGKVEGAEDAVASVPVLSAFSIYESGEGQASTTLPEVVAASGLAEDDTDEVDDDEDEIEELPLRD